MTATIETDATVRDPRAGKNPLKIRNIHHVELCAGNAKQSAFYYRKAFGFSQLAYSGLETGNRETTSYVLSQGKIRFVITSPLTEGHAHTRHIGCHGDGVIDIALQVEDADDAFHEAVRRGARPAVEPHDAGDQFGVVRRAAIHTYGDTLHSFISYGDYRGAFLPGFQPAEIAGQSAGLLLVDHIVGNVELGKMNVWADWYYERARLLALHHFRRQGHLHRVQRTDVDRDVGRQPAGEVPDQRAGAGPEEEPDRGVPRLVRGPGVQHIALLTGDILSTVRSCGPTASSS